jgi:hypothetical protein
MNGLVDPKGDILIDTDRLEPKLLTLREQQALLSAMLRFVVMLHGPEALQLIATYAESIEAELPSDESIGDLVAVEGVDFVSVPRPVTDEQHDIDTAETVEVES